MDIVVRQASLKDAEKIARVSVSSWKTTYKGILADDFLSSLTYTSRIKNWEDIIRS